MDFGRLGAKSSCRFLLEVAVNDHLSSPNLEERKILNKALDNVRVQIDKRLKCRYKEITFYSIY